MLIATLERVTDTAKASALLPSVLNYALTEWPIGPIESPVRARASNRINHHHSKGSIAGRRVSVSIGSFSVVIV